jgi:hypothetical protein
MQDAPVAVGRTTRQRQHRIAALVNATQNPKFLNLPSTIYVQGGETSIPFISVQQACTTSELLTYVHHT